MSANRGMTIISSLDAIVVHFLALTTYWRNPSIDTDVWQRPKRQDGKRYMKAGPLNPWTAEHEDKLPAALQNWSQVKWS